MDFFSHVCYTVYTLNALQGERNVKHLDLKTALMILERMDAVALTDDQGQYIYTNQNWSRKSGVSASNAYGKHPWEIVLDSRVRQVLEYKKPILGHVIDDGGQGAVVNYYPIFDEQNSFFGVLIWTLYSSMDTALRYSRRIEQLSKELNTVRGQLENYCRASYSINNIIGVSSAIQQMKQEIIDCAATNSSVLIEGESGTGKELVAHSIHDLSNRNRNRFVRVNCAAIPPDLMESEFFGYEEGSFTGARRGGRQGKFELASGGSIFFDEVNSLPATMQPKFLRVLQEHEIERVGGQDTIPVDIRVIAASNCSLAELVEKGQFRMDLYYRLNVVYIRVPPLREHLEDIPVLTRYLIDKLNHSMGTEITYPEAETLELLMEYPWPGNTRQLQNALERAINRCHGTVLRPEHFDLDAPRTTSDVSLFQTATHRQSLKDWQSEQEQALLRKVLEHAHHNKSAAAQELGISRTALYKKLKKYGLC